MAKKKTTNKINDNIEDNIINDNKQTAETVETEAIKNDKVNIKNKKKIPYMNDRGLIKIKAIKPAYNMTVGSIWERPGHIADSLVREGVAEYIEFIEV